jgi:hypothetical protein
MKATTCLPTSTVPTAPVHEDHAPVDDIMLELKSPPAIELEMESSPYASISHTQLVFFGLMFGHFIRKRCRQSLQEDSAQQVISEPIVRLLDMLFRMAPEGAVFIFTDFPQPTNPTASTTSLTYQHVLNALKGKELMMTRILRHSIKPMRASGSANALDVDVFVVVKPFTIQLPPSFYSTVSYLRSHVLQFQSTYKSEEQSRGHWAAELKAYLRSHAHHDRLNLATLVSHARFNEESYELDESAVLTNISLLSALFSDALGWKSATKLQRWLDDGVKKRELLLWFERYRRFL